MNRSRLTRRTPLSPGKPPARKAIKRKPKKRYRGDGRAAHAEWRAEHESCGACWKHYRTFGVVLECHHVLTGRVGRPDYRWAWLMLCRECHTRLQGGRDNLAVCLTLKREQDPDGFNLELMQQWMLTFGRERLPVPAALPPWITQLREGWNRP